MPDPQDTALGFDWLVSGRQPGPLGRALSRTGQVLGALLRPAPIRRLPAMSDEWLAEHERSASQHGRT